MESKLLLEARSSVATAVSVTGRQVPDKLEQEAALLLRDLWVVSADHGVEPADWAATNARLPVACVDVLVAVARRPRTD